MRERSVAMKVLVVGNGGREHVLVWKLAQSPHVRKLYCAPGNAGSREQAENVPIAVDDIAGLRRFALEQGIDLTVVGPEQPLSLGITDAFAECNLRIFGPAQAAAQLETSKAFAKRFMWDEGIPTAQAVIYSDYATAVRFIEEHDGPLVVKADGLAAGKGVTVCKNADDAFLALHACMVAKKFGDAGLTVVLEELLVGEEVSFHVLVDGEQVLPLATAQDYKKLYDGDGAPNTGGMGAYSPAPIVTPQLHLRIMNQIVYPTVRAMAARGIPYRGVLYVGLMIVDGEPYVLEFNARFGDPETQPLLVRMRNDILPLLRGVAEGNIKGLTAEYTDDTAVCVVLTTKGYPGTLEQTGLRVRGLGRASRYADTYVFHASTTLDDDGYIITGPGGRAVSVTSRDKNFSRSVARVYRAVRCIDWKQKGGEKIRRALSGSTEKRAVESGAYRRSDIGHRLLQ